MTVSIFAGMIHPDAMALVGHYLLSKTSRASKASDKDEAFMTADPFQLTVPVNRATNIEPARKEWQNS